MQTIIDHLVADKLSRKVEPDWVLNWLLGEGYSEHEIELAMQKYYNNPDITINFQYRNVIDPLEPDVGENK